MYPVRLDPAHPFKREALPPHRMRPRQTATGDLHVLCHLGVPRVDRDRWALTIDGLVDRPRTLRFDELMRYPKAELASVHECCGNPLEPLRPMRRVGNVIWGGVRLADVLADCLPTAQARYMWCYGADCGVFAEASVDAYVKDLPLSRVHADVLIGYELNGSPLPAEHGYPARLVVPGFYGTNSVKWLTRITLADHRAGGLFNTRFYQDPVYDDVGQDTGETVPVWSIAPESLIVTPVPDDILHVSTEFEIWGWAWADGGVKGVEVQVGDGQPWRSAHLESPRAREWQRYALPWTPIESGVVVLASRAIATDRSVQSTSGRNAIHRVAVTVR